MLLIGAQSLPDWDGIHPAVVHFPIALLLVAPILIVASLVSRGSWRAWAWSALIVMGIGTVAAWVAVGSGHAAGQLVDKAYGLERAIGRHEALGVTTRNIFTLLTLAYAGLMLLPRILRHPLAETLRIGSYVAFLVLYLAGAAELARTANAGGHLVHGHGVRAIVDRADYNPPAQPPPAGGPASTAASPGQKPPRP